MSGAIHSLPKYAFMAWCSVKEKHRGYFYETWYLTLSEDYRLGPI